MAQAAKSGVSLDSRRTRKPAVSRRATSERSNSPLKTAAEAKATIAAMQARAAQQPCTRARMHPSHASQTSSRANDEMRVTPLVARHAGHRLRRALREELQHCADELAAQASANGAGAPPPPPCSLSASRPLAGQPGPPVSNRVRLRLLAVGIAADSRRRGSRTRCQVPGADSLSVGSDPVAAHVQLSFDDVAEIAHKLRARHPASAISPIEAPLPTPPPAEARVALARAFAEHDGGSGSIAASQLPQALLSAVRAPRARRESARGSAHRREATAARPHSIDARTRRVTTRVAQSNARRRCRHSAYERHLPHAGL